MARSKSTGYLRAILWVRRAATQPKNVGGSCGSGYNVAAAELAGMFMVAECEIAESLNGERLRHIMELERLPREVVAELEKELKNVRIGL